MVTIVPRIQLVYYVAQLIFCRISLMIFDEFLLKYCVAFIKNVVTKSTKIIRLCAMSKTTQFGSRNMCTVSQWTRFPDTHFLSENDPQNTWNML